MLEYRHVATRFFNRPLLLMPESAHMISAFLQSRMRHPEAARGAAAQREDAVMGVQGSGHRLRLARPEVGLALVDEDLGHRATLGGLDILVGVACRRPPGPGEQPRDGGLASARWPGDHPDRGPFRAHTNSPAVPCVSPTSVPHGE